MNVQVPTLELNLSLKNHFKDDDRLRIGDFLLFGFDNKGRYCVERLKPESTLIPLFMKELNCTSLKKLDIIV